MADATDKPKRRRRKKAEDEPVPEARRTSETESEATASDPSASDADSYPGEDEIQPTPADGEAAEEAADVVLEAAEQVDEDSASEPALDKSTPPRRRASKPKAEPAEAQADKPARPAPTRRRPQREPGAPAPVVRAQAKYVRSSARKARLVCDHLRGKSIEEARAILAHTPRAVARDWSKLLESAVANAENNHELIGEDLYVKAIQADEGPTLKRYRPRAMGRATRIRKRTSHLTILLTPKE